MNDTISRDLRANPLTYILCALLGLLIWRSRSVNINTVTAVAAMPESAANAPSEDPEYSVLEGSSLPDDESTCVWCHLDYPFLNPLMDEEDQAARKADMRKWVMISYGTGAKSLLACCHNHMEQWFMCGPPEAEKPSEPETPNASE